MLFCDLSLKKAILRIMNNKNFPHGFWECSGRETMIFIPLALIIFTWKKLKTFGRLQLRENAQILRNETTSMFLFTSRARASFLGVLIKWQLVFTFNQKNSCNLCFYHEFLSDPWKQGQCKHRAKRTFFSLHQLSSTSIAKWKDF